MNNKTKCEQCGGNGTRQEPIGGSDHIVCWKCARSGSLLDASLTPNDIYKMHYEELVHTPSILCGCYYDHLRGSGLDSNQVQYHCDESPRIGIRIIKYFQFDYRPRYWRLATVWFDLKPIMIIQNAGREGDDHEERFITDEDGFRKMAVHIRTLLKSDEIIEPIEDVVLADAPLGRKLIEFYGNELDGYFRRYESI